MNIKKFITELRRRNVIKASVAYLVVTWMIFQVCSIVLPAFNAEDYMQLIIKLAVVGFPFWIVFSWIYDITPDGIRKTQLDDSVGDDDHIKIGKRLNFIIIASLSVVVILLAFNQIKNREYIRKGKEIVEARINRSVAVLPFNNTKPDPESDYFGYAIANQIIGNLNYLKNINVISAASVRKYINKEFSLEEVKESLNANYALVGNYLKENDRIRLNVELIDLETNTLIWRSDNIEVNFENSFQLQDTVARKVAVDLNIQFSDSEIKEITKDKPGDSEAYSYYLRSLWYDLDSEGDSLAIDLLQRSIDLDPGFAPAHAELGFRSQRMAQFEMEDPENYRSSEDHYLKALEIDPNNLDALSYLTIFYTESSNTEEAVRLTKKMRSINPNNAAVRFASGYLYRYIGLLKESVREMEIALELDPGKPNFSRLGISYLALNEYDKAIAAFDKVGASYAKIWKGMTYFKMGNYDEAQVFFNELIEANKEPYLMYSAIAYNSIINNDIQTGIDAVNFLDKSNSVDSEGHYYWSTMYASLGDANSALRMLNNAVFNGYYNYTLMNMDPLLDGIRNEPEFENILERAKVKHEYFKNRILE